MTDNTLAGLAELIALPNWVNCGDDKIPYTPSLEGDPAPAKANDPTTWRTFAEASAAVDAGRFPQVGFEFTAPYWGIDIDHCRDAATGRMTPRARAIVMLANTYAEPSPSGTSVHIIGKGPLPARILAEGKQGKKAGDYEWYGGGRYFRMTLQPFPGFDQVRAVDTTTAELLAGLLWPGDAPQASTQASPRLAPITALPADDTDLLAMAFAAKAGGDLARMHRGEYLVEDQSDDDWHYLKALAFWTQGDPGRVRRIALSSGRVREKWATKRPGGDYLDYSIGRACADQPDHYDPQRDGRPALQFAGVAAPALDARQLAEIIGTIEGLRVEVHQLEGALAHSRQEQARQGARILELETTVAAYEATTAHPDQTVGGAAFDIAEETHKAYQRGDVLTIEGKDFARVVCKRAAKRRSAGTVGRGLKTIAAAGQVETFTREEEIETEQYRGKVDITYIHIPEARRDSPATIVLDLLPPATEKKHGGRRRIAVPQDVIDQPHPVKRVREHVEKFISLVDDKQIGEPVTTPLGEDYWTHEGEHITKEEATRFQVEIGSRPPTTLAPSWKPKQTRLQVDASIYRDTRFQDETGSAPAPMPLYGPPCRVGGCGRPPVVDGFCSNHAALIGQIDAAAGD